MAARWDDIEILQTIDRLQEQMDGRPLWISGYDLAREVAGTHVVDQQQAPGFVQELHIAYEAGLLTFGQSSNARQQDASNYLQQIRDIALTVPGRDRARGRVVFQPLPDPAEDDNRKISDLIFRRIAEAIDEQDVPADVASLLADEGIPPPPLELPGRPEEFDAYAGRLAIAARSAVTSTDPAPCAAFSSPSRRNVHTARQLS